MLYTENLPDIKLRHISEVKEGDFIANVGKILEIEELESYYSLVIERMNEKQVLKFEKNGFLILL